MKNMANIEYNLAKDVQKYGELYDKSHKYFSNNERRAAIWKALSSVYKINAKAKWKAMRMHVWNEKKKENFSWDLYPHMRFLEVVSHTSEQDSTTKDSSIDDSSQINEELEEQNDVPLDSTKQEELFDEEAPTVDNARKSLYKFVQEVRRHEELYDRGHELFFEHKYKETIWKALSNKYKIDAKTKWSLMRDRFVKAKKNNQTNWHLYPYLTFLENHITQKQRRPKPFLEEPIEISHPEEENEIHKEMVDEDISEYILDDVNAEKGNALPWSDEETSSEKSCNNFLDFTNNNSSRQGQLSKDQTLYNFVQEVEKYGELYNKAHTHFCNFERKDAIWKALSEKYNMDAKAKWNTMRERFSREKKKINSTWHLYPYLYFLEQHIHHRQKNKNKDFELPILQVETQHHDIYCSDVEEQTNPIDVSDVSQINVTQSYHDSAKRKCLKRESINNSQGQPMFDVLYEVPKKINNDSIDDDDENEDWHFLQSLKYKMKKMRDEEKTQFKIEMLLQAEKATLNSKRIPNNNSM